VPVLRVLSERALTEDENGVWRERELPVLALRFDYGGRQVRPVGGDELWADAIDPPDDDLERDLAAEQRFQCLLERHGAVELACLSGCVTLLGSSADYVVNVDGNVHAICSFGAHALPDLERHGFCIEIDPDYPYQLVDADTAWYARVEADGEQPDWFSLELGVDVDGRRIDLLPALMELLDGSPDGESLASLARHAARCRALPVGDGRWVAIPWTRLRRVLSVLADMYAHGRTPANDVLLHEHQAHALGELAAAFEVEGLSVRWDGPASTPLLERGRALAQPPRVTPRPVALRAELRSYQQAGLSWLCHLRDHGAHGVLADDMGLGKTLQTIALLAGEREARRMDLPSLVVMPTSLVGNWKRELSTFAPHLRVLVLHGPGRHACFEQLPRAQVVLTTYPVLVRDLARLEAQPFHYVVLDEAQAIKSSRSLAHRAARRLDARHRLCLTGTPIENNLGELWSLFDFLMPGLLGNAEQFRLVFRHPIERDGSDARLAVLRDRVSPYMLRRLKESVARELPPKTELNRTVELEGDQRDLYESIRVAAHGQVRNAIRAKGIAGASITILDALTQLRQVCCDPRLVRVDAAREVKSSAKYGAFFTLLEAELSRGRRVLVFSQFTRMLSLLSQGLTERSIEHTLLTGATQDRQAAVDAFQSGRFDVFLISLKAGGTGLNLTRADTVIHYDPWWNAAAQMQATDRAHRIGQKNPVFVHNLVVAGSVEERMLALQSKKRRLAETLLGADPQRAGLSENDLEDLFAPLESD